MSLEDDILSDLMTFSRTLTQDGQLRWIGASILPEFSRASFASLCVLWLVFGLFLAHTCSLLGGRPGERRARAGLRCVVLFNFPLFWIFIGFRIET